MKNNVLTSNQTVLLKFQCIFCFRCSKINSLTERTEESLLSAIFLKRLSSDIPFVYSSLAGEVLFLNLLIGQKYGVRTIFILRIERYQKRKK